MKNVLDDDHVICVTQVEAETLVIKSDNVAEAISEEINKFKISKLVIGASQQNIFMRYSLN